MNPYNLQTSVLVLVVAFAAACGVADDSDVEGRDESFLALMGSDDGKADSLAVTEGSAEAVAVLEVANTFSFHDLRQTVGLDQRATANIIARRDRNPGDAADDTPFVSLHDLDATPWIGMRAFVRLLDHARVAGFIDAARRPLTCDVDTACGDGICHANHCYDVRQIDLGLDGTMALGIADDATWWIRAHAGGTTVRDARGSTSLDEIETTSYRSADLDLWFATLPDGSLTTVTRSGRDVLPEFGTSTTTPALNRAVAAAYDAQGTLFVAAEARDVDGTPQGLVILAQHEAGWREELKKPFDGQRAPGETQTTTFTRAADGRVQVWVDVGSTARRYDRQTDGTWREAMIIDMAAEGFGDRAADRSVEFLQGADGVVFIHRSTWNFARLHQVIRVEDTSMTAVIDMPTATRHVAAHADGTFSVVSADGSLSHFEHGTLQHGTATLPVAIDGTEIVRTRGADLYVLKAGALVVLSAR